MADWYYASRGEQIGPLSLEALRSLISSGRVSPTDLAWTEGMAQWRAAEEVPELRTTAIFPPTAQFAPPMVEYQTPPLQRSQHASLALTGMILSLVSIALGVLGVLTAIAGLICGWVALRGMKRTGDARSRGFAIAAVAVGASYVTLFLITVAALFLLLKHK